MCGPNPQDGNETKNQESRILEHFLSNDINQSDQNETSGTQATSSNSQNENQPTHPKFQFIEVNQFGKPQSAGMRRIIHANARRRGTLKKKAPAPRAAPRKIVSKHIQSQPPIPDSVNLLLGSALIESNPWEHITSETNTSASDIPRIHDLDSDEEFTSASGNLSQSESNMMMFASQSFPMNLMPEFDRWQSREANTPYCLRMVTDAPVLYMQARTWPFPYPLRGPIPKTSLWMSESPIPAPDAYARRHCLNKTSQPAAFIARSTEYFIYKGETIRWISDQLSKYQMGGTDSIGDSIIGVILCLTMWEVSFVFLPSPKLLLLELKLIRMEFLSGKIGRSYSRWSAEHMKGIKRIVNLRGGLDKLEDSFQLKVFLVDMYVAVVTNGIPLFRGLQLAKPRPAPLPIIGLGQLSIPDSPLFQYNNRRLDSTLINSHSRFCPLTIRILQHMADLTNAYTTSNRPTLNTLLANDFLILNPPVQHPTTLFGIIQNTAIIYRAAFVLPPISLSSPLNYQFVTTIIHLLSFSDDDETWARFPGILLWIILTGTVAARSHPERSYFIHFFGKITSVARWQWWDEIVGAFETFFPVRRIADAVRG